ncbi:flagellar basal body P-ring formation chaperone FlgA [Emcibacter sp.]|uniref:flagellar basal body P-ring formation chaperone FlgA n=1 Tax=Emcibacter sp. TaxID=1979954 RepID=UPI002AA87C4E|nr:flagellar basal body P-ring formation chaperone FlgA [Emcibacter sp.]
MLKIKYVIAIVICFLFWLSGGQLTIAGIADLKREARVESEIVTLGDLFENLDDMHDLWVMDAPAPGKKAYISASYLAQLTRQHGVYWRNSRAVKQVAVYRAGQQIDREELIALLSEESSQYISDGRERHISLYGANQNIIVPLQSGAEDLEIAKFDLDRKSGKFTATINYPVGAGNRQSTAISGKLTEVAYIPALRKSIIPGTIIEEQNIKWIPVPLYGVGKNITRSQDQLLGMTVRRPMKSDTPVRLSDLKRPEIIHRGKLVNITYETSKMTLTVIGKAMENGGTGDVIRVMNANSLKTMEALVTGPGEVQVISAGMSLAAN